MRNNNRTIARPALGLAICVICLLIFRGMASLLGAIFIPPVLAVFTYRSSKTILLGVIISLTIISILFFTTQTIFVIIYILLALNIRAFFPQMNKRKYFFPLYIAATMISIYTGIRLTQLMFMVPIHTMMVRLSSGNIFIYMLIITIEGSLAGFSHYIIVKNFDKRLKL